jgi:hypothetical protein
VLRDLGRVVDDDAVTLGGRIAQRQAQERSICSK